MSKWKPETSSKISESESEVLDKILASEDLEQPQLHNKPNVPQPPANPAEHGSNSSWTIPYNSFSAELTKIVQDFATYNTEPNAGSQTEASPGAPVTPPTVGSGRRRKGEKKPKAIKIIQPPKIKNRHLIALLRPQPHKRPVGRPRKTTYDEIFPISTSTLMGVQMQSWKDAVQAANITASYAASTGVGAPADVRCAVPMLCAVPPADPATVRPMFFPQMLWEA